MGFHLQLFPPKFWDWVIVLLVLFLPAAATAFVLHNFIWFVVVPLGIIVLAFLIAARPSKRRVTPQQFADELEKHLLGTEGEWDWDDVTSVAIADDRLERIRWGLPKFDRLSNERDRDELRSLIAALRRGEVPQVVPPKDLTYRAR
jgi:hypothetical protein